MKKVYVDEERFLSFLEEPRTIREVQAEFNLKSVGALGSRMRRLQDKGKVLVSPNTRGQGFKYHRRTNKKQVETLAENLKAAINTAPKNRLFVLLDTLTIVVEDIRKYVEAEGLAQEKLKQLESIIKE